MREQAYTDEMIGEHVTMQPFVLNEYNPSTTELEAMVAEIRDHYEEVLSYLRDDATAYRKLFAEHGGDYSMCRRDGEVIEEDEREHIAQVKKSLDRWLEIG